jgi:hypothetical protein
MSHAEAQGRREDNGGSIAKYPKHSDGAERKTRLLHLRVTVLVYAPPRLCVRLFNCQPSLTNPNRKPHHVLFRVFHLPG